MNTRTIQGGSSPGYSLFSDRTAQPAIPAAAARQQDREQVDSLWQRAAAAEFRCYADVIPNPAHCLVYGGGFGGEAAPKFLFLCGARPGTLLAPHKQSKVTKRSW